MPSQRRCRSRLRSIRSAFASEQPVKEQVGELATNAASAARGNQASYSQNWRFDMGLHLAASDLLPMEKKRAVVFVGSGNLGELAFEQYSLSELASYLANNGIIFYAIMLGGNQVGEELHYLCNQTGGEVLSLYQPQGVGPVIRDIAATPSGTYILSYCSQLLSTELKVAGSSAVEAGIVSATALYRLGAHDC